MNNYKFTTNNRDYSEYTIYNSQTLKEIKREHKIYLKINPYEMKLFNQDIFNFKFNQINILHSSTREIQYLSGILDLTKKYGKYNKNTLYKVIPDDKRLPEFLVPYTYIHKKTIKNNKFSKINRNNIKIDSTKKYKTNFCNIEKKNINTNTNNNDHLFKYITFKYVNWNKERPLGYIVKMIGNVNELSCFYEYQLYCKSLYSSIQNFNKETLDKIKSETENEMIESIQQKYNIQNRLDYNIISIDPKHCKDIDDAMSYKYDKIKDIHIVSIYISNVSLWMDYLNLWNSFANRVSTIYLPDRKRPMLPTLLSDNLCSLIQNHKRIALTLDLIIKDDIIIDTNIINSLIRVRKNYTYGEKDIYSDIVYQNIFNIISRIKFKYNYIDTVYDTHDLIAYLMVLTNKTFADEFLNFKNGIFRSLKLNEEYPTLHLDIPKDMKKFLQSWNSSGGFYMKYNEEIYDKNIHQLLKLNGYIHITSPIRRLADLLNIIQLQKNKNMCKISDEGLLFLEKWSSQNMVDYMNTTMRSVRKVQNSCFMMKACHNNNELLNKIQSGYTFDKIIRNDGLYQYMVYLENPKLQTCGRFTTRFELDNYKKYYFRLYLFENLVDGKKKIMIGYEENDNN